MWILARAQRWEEILLKVSPTWPQILGMIAVLTVVGWLAMQVRRMLHNEDSLADSRQQMLLSLHELREEGDVTAEEFRLINCHLGNPSEVRTAEERSELTKIDEAEANRKEP